METVFLAQLCVCDSQKDYTFLAPSLNKSHCPAVSFLKTCMSYEDAATSLALLTYGKGTLHIIRCTNNTHLLGDGTKTSS